jgi:hypothetical protein
MDKRAHIWEMPKLAIHEEDGSITHPKYVEYDEQWARAAKAIEEAEGLLAGTFEKTYYQMYIQNLEHNLTKTCRELEKYKSRCIELEEYHEGRTHVTDLPPKNGPYLAYFDHKKDGWGVHPVVFKDYEFYQKVYFGSERNSFYLDRVYVNKWWYLPSEINLRDAWDFQKWQN